MKHATACLFLLLPACCLAASDEPEQARFTFVYEATVTDLPEGAERVRIWLPLPIETPDQEVEGLRVASSHGTVTISELGKHDGRVLYAEAKGEAVTLRYEADILRRATSGGQRCDKDDLERHLQASTLIPLDGKVARIAAELPLSDDPLATGQALYRHTLDRMRYDKPDGGEWGRGDAEWACDSRYGNCTDFHSYFIGLARSKGIPARFVMGFPVPGPEAGAVAEIGGYHCWAWFWAGDQQCWKPVDISEADKHPERAEFYFGNLDPWRVALVQGRDLELQPAADSGRLNLFVYPHVEVDGQVHHGVGKRFSRSLR